MSVVQMAPQASLEIENRWDDAHAAKLSPAELLLYRSNLLGSDKRITNFGGGNTSAKIKEKDPLTGAGSRRALGQGLGRRSRHHEARRLLHSIYGEVSRAREVLPSRHRQRQHAGAAVCALRVQPESARRQHRHAAARPRRSRARRSHASGRADRDRRVGRFEGADRGNLRRRDRLVAVDPARATSSASSCASSRRRIPKLKGAVLEAHGLFTWADTSKACYENTLDIINRATAWLTRQQPRQAPVRRGHDAGADHRSPPRNRGGHHADRFAASFPPPPKA